MYVCVAWAHIHICMWRSEVKVKGPALILQLIFETEPLTETGTHRLAKLTGQDLRVLLYHSPAHPQ